MQPILPRANLIALILVAGIGQSCAPQLSVDGVVFDAATALTVLTFQSQTRPQWRIHPDTQEIHTPQRTLTFTGSCQRGVSQVALIDTSTGNPLGQSVPCNLNKSFKWTGTVPNDGTYPLQLRAILGNGSQSDLPEIFPIHVDTIAPPPPVITSHSGPVAVISNPNVLLEGSISDDTWSMTSVPTGSILILRSPSRFEFPHTMNSGESRTFQFVAQDFAGNSSTPATITLTYIANATLAGVVFTGLGGAVSMTSGGGFVDLQISGSEAVISSPNPASGTFGTKLSTGMAQISSDGGS